jgi:GT2 family glycosyltransferase/glycosyltransferase involved in cell wall biosynthesis
LRKAKGAARRIKRLAKLAGGPQGSAEAGPIELWIDSPAEDERVVTNVLRIEGWAFSRTGAIAQIAVFLDRQELSQVEYGLPRVDVMEVFNLPSEDCGFSGLVNLPKNAAAGQHALRLVVTNDRGHTRTVQRKITLTDTGHAAVGMTFWIDSPAENITTAGRLEIAGWAFSPEFPIRFVMAHIDGTPVQQLTHGITRDDVYTVYPTPFACMSGFRGQIEFPGARPGKHVLTLHISTHNGATAMVSRTFVVRPSTVAHLEVERAECRGDTLTISGFALMPGKRLPWMVSAYAGGELLGTCRAKLSRPDVRQRFPDVPGAGQSGFELRCSAPAPKVDHPPSTLSLNIQCTDADGQIAKQDVVVTHRPDELVQSLAACRVDLEDLVWQARLQARIEPTILNLATDYPLASILNACDVFTLPGKREKAGAEHPTSLDADTMAMADMADIVMAEEAAAQAAQKARTARYVTATLKRIKAGSAHGKKGTQSASVVAEWNPQASLSAIPSVSIIMPVYNKIDYTRRCVERVLETARPYIPLEVIVVDDCSMDETPAVIAELARADARVRYVRNETNLGFLRSSNHGADVATGDVLIFLNNDTLPEPRWIEPLLHTLLTQPQAGAAGGKLMYPDGTLQEAGGVIYNNGDGANFGRNSVYPEHPLFHTQREVDYCSGALLATPRALFFELGKFDERYSPAYCEDSDYCFKVREAGRRVYFQPDSAIIHFEGVTSGRDTNQGLKRYQVINREKFVDRWRDALSRQGPPPDNYDRRVLNELWARYEREQDPETGAHTPKRALVAFSSVPEFNHEGGSRQHAALVDFLQHFGWQVTVFAVYKPGADTYIRQLQQRGIQVYCSYRCVGVGDSYVEDFSELVREGRFQLALMAPWVITEECMAALRTLSPETRIVTNTMDLQFLRDIRRALTGADADEGDVMIPPAVGTELIRELNAYANSDLVTTVSVEETALLRSFLGARGRVEMLPHTEGIPTSPFGISERHGMLFVGNFRHPPNAEAVEFLFSKVLPLVDPAVLRKHPVTILGTDMPDSLRALARGLDGVHMLGWVPSVMPYLHRARINLVPLLHGAGTKVKLIQALMVGTPSVSTTVGAEGLALEDGQHVLVADTPEQFAQCMTRLATDDVVWARLALASRDHVLARHGPDAVRARFGELIDQVMQTPSQAAPQPGDAVLPGRLPSAAHRDAALVK